MAEIALSLYLTYFSENRWEHLTNMIEALRARLGPIRGTEPNETDAFVRP
jgi:hypothetical protein